MSNTNLNLAAAIADRFQTCDREQLEAFAKAMEIEFHPNIADERLRDRMLERIGMKLNDGQTVEVSANPEARPFEVLPPEEFTNEELNNLIRLNLTPNGRWEGRRRIVNIPRPESMKGSQAHPWTWGRHQVMVPWGVQVSVPYPIYKMMLNTEMFNIDQEHTVDKKGQKKIINHRRVERRFNWADFGDDPETIGLPRSQKEQFRAVAKATNYFEGWNRVQLARLCRRLSLRYERGTEVEAIREIILYALGFDPDMIDDGEGGGFLPEGEAEGAAA